MNVRFWFSGLVAFGLEALVVAILIISLLPKAKQTYTFQDQTKLDFIQIEEIIKEEPKKPKASPQPKPQEKKQSKPKQETSKKPSPVAGSDVKKLFERVDNLDAPVHQEVIEDDRPLFSSNSIKTQNYSYNQDSQSIQQETSKIQDRLDQIFEKEIEIKTSTPVDNTDGVYDVWFAEIKKILSSKWQNEFYEKVSLVASITITNSGHFSFRIIKYSTNSSYNTYMQDLLKSLEYETFPPYPKGNRIVIEVSFNTGEGLQ